MAEENEVKKICCNTCPYADEDIVDDIGASGTIRRSIVKCRRNPLDPTWYRVPNPDSDWCGEHPEKRQEMVRLLHPKYFSELPKDLPPLRSGYHVTVGEVGLPDGPIEKCMDCGFQTTHPEHVKLCLRNRPFDPIASVDPMLKDDPDETLDGAKFPSGDPDKP